MCPGSLDVAEIISQMDIPMEKRTFSRDYIPEFKVLSIMYRNMGDVAASILRRQKEKLKIVGTNIPLEKYDDLLRGIEEASSIVLPKHLRTIMVRQLSGLKNV